MKIYLAATAPGNERNRVGGYIKLPRRLFSFYLIQQHKFECDTVFMNIIIDKNYR